MPKRTSDTLRSTNPKKFTKDQHVFPRSAIKRFGSGPQFMVQVQRLNPKAVDRYSPGAKLFCAFRAWDQTTEDARSRKTEAMYKALADEIASGAVQHLTRAQDQIVTDFYGLWKARHLARTQPIGPLRVPGASGEAPLTWETRENLEANGYGFTQEGSFPSHIAGSFQMMAIRVHTSRTFAGYHWGIVRASDGEFLVPDNCASLAIVPVNPTICLGVHAPDFNVGATEVARLNGLLLQQAHAYYFARELDACPLPLA